MNIHLFSVHTFHPAVNRETKSAFFLANWTPSRRLVRHPHTPLSTRLPRWFHASPHPRWLPIAGLQCLSRRFNLVVCKVPKRFGMVLPSRNYRSVLMITHALRRTLETGGCFLLLATFFVATGSAAALIGTDLDPVDGPITLDPNFSFGGDTTSASDSISSIAVGVDGFGSLFGGDGSLVDTYVYTYDVDALGDNLPLAGGTVLNDDGPVMGIDGGGRGIASGIPAGGSGDYRVYATWPITNNVSGGDTTYTLSGPGGDLLTVSLDQNTINGFVDPDDGLTYAGGEWVLLGTAALDATQTYTLTQESGSATFVSMRAAGILFDPVPEPGSVVLLGICGALLAGWRRR
jgi:hypothetical protein